ncbi:MAG: tyrosine-type DNA invertase [Kluyvera sp.]|uniref:tyrosine-type DNA invertase n=1 Tax=Kluyvera sp. TaxID=1538228 RepID=UPI003F30EA66
MTKTKNRNFLTQQEIEQLLAQIPKGRNHARNTCMLLLCYFHGLRVSELLGLKLADFDLSSRVLFVRRLKNGFSTSHPLNVRVFNAINTWLTLRSKKKVASISDYLFPSPKGDMLTRQTIYLLFQRYGELAHLDIKVHPHMLRHACGFELANKGMDTRLIQDYLGHRNISHTVRYTASNPERFRIIRW